MSAQFFQNPLPFARNMLANPTSKAVGTLGETIIAYQLQRAGYDVSFTHPGQRRGDLRVIDTETGEVFAVEVKTSRRAKDGKWRFTLYKAGHTDYRDSDYVVLCCAQPTGATVTFVIPQAALGQRSQLTITSNPIAYAGRWAAYRQDSQVSLKPC